MSKATSQMNLCQLHMLSAQFDKKWTGSELLWWPKQGCKWTCVNCTCSALSVTTSEEETHLFWWPKQGCKWACVSCTCSALTVTINKKLVSLSGNQSKVTSKLVSTAHHAQHSGQQQIMKKWAFASVQSNITSELVSTAHAQCPVWQQIKQKWALVVTKAGSQVHLCQLHMFNARAPMNKKVVSFFSDQSKATSTLNASDRVDMFELWAVTGLLNYS